MVCKKCNVDKPASNFYIRKNAHKGKSYRLSACKQCHKKLAVERRARFRRENPKDYTRQHTVQARKWRLANPEKARAMQKKYRDNRRKKLMELIGGAKCNQCGFNDYRALHIDHINGGGNREKIMLGQASFPLRFIREEIEKHGINKYQVLCANCNWIKRHENKEHLQYACDMVVSPKKAKKI